MALALGRKKTDRSPIVIATIRPEAQKVITDPNMITPTGKFNVYNTQYDVY